MKVYNKTMITLGMAFLVMLLLITVSVNHILTDNYRHIEELEMKDNVKRIERAIQTEVDYLDTTVYDWAARDDTYFFIKYNNSEYIIANLDDDTFSNLNINFVFFFDDSEDIVFSKYYNLEEQKVAEIPLSLVDVFHPGNPFLEHPDTNSNISGLFLSSESPMIIASRPVIKSNKNGPVRGTLVMGRFLDETMIGSIEENTLLPVELIRFHSTDLPDVLEYDRTKLSDDGNFVGIAETGETVFGYGLIEDVFGNPALVLRTQMDREIYLYGLHIINSIIYVVICLFLIVTLAISLILKKNLFSRLDLLGDRVNAVGLKGDLSSRLQIDGNDELSTLADNINEMLSSLQETSSLLNSTIETTVEGIVIIDNDWHVLLINPSFIQMCNLPPELHSEKNSAKILDHILKVIENKEDILNKINERIGSTIKGKTLVQFKDGRAFEVHSLPLMIDNTVGGRMYIFHEVTEIIAREEELKRQIRIREKIENALIVSEEKFSKIATFANDAMIIIDGQGQSIFWNKAATRIFGYQENEVIGRDVHSLLASSNYPEAFRQDFEQLIKVGKGNELGKTLEMEGKRKDGTEFPIELSLSTIELSDGSWNAVAIIRDITERKQMDLMEKEILERLTTIINNVDGGIMMIDAVTKEIVDINPVAARLIGLSKEEIVGKLCHNFVCPSDEGKCPIIDLNQKVDKSERILLTRDGKELPVVKSAVSVKMNDKEYLIESFYDLSVRMKVEETLIEAKLAAEESNRAKSEFLASMSHELRTPLNAIIGFSDLLLLNDQTPSDKQNRYIKNISTSGKHLLEIINDILDLSKVEAGMTQLTIEEFHVLDVLDEILKSFIPLVTKKNLKIDISKNEDIIISADRLKFKQILYNLVGNAFKFTHEGGNVFISVRKSGQMLQMVIKDDGIGIPLEDQDFLFEPFKQVDSALNRSYEGTGLGLAIVKRYVEMHGGTIRVESEPGRGSSFICELPLHNY
ncbi:PAS domain S-box protein [Methanolobus sp. ZRKC2]|uniref:PAS domain S-box protein n=1 Tax=Methanolobus sp. ZRKC2 TaxID=3125783 RepID=UPI003244AB09